MVLREPRRGDDVVEAEILERPDVQDGVLRAVRPHPLAAADDADERAVMPEPVQRVRVDAVDVAVRVRVAVAVVCPAPTTAPAAHAGAASARPHRAPKRKRVAHRRRRITGGVYELPALRYPVHPRAVHQRVPHLVHGPEERGHRLPRRRRDVLVEVGDDDPVLLVHARVGEVILPVVRDGAEQERLALPHLVEDPSFAQARYHGVDGVVVVGVPGVHDDHDVRRRHLRYVDVMAKELFQERRRGGIGRGGACEDEDARVGGVEAGELAVGGSEGLRVPSEAPALDGQRRASSRGESRSHR